MNSKDKDIQPSVFKTNRWLKIFSNNIFWVYILSFLFIGSVAYMLPIEDYGLMLVPIALAVVIAFLANFELVFFINLIFVPLSLPLKEFASGLSFDIQLPTDLMMVGMLALLIYKSARRTPFNQQFLKHPISIAVFAHLIWMLITCFTSTLPVVSFKFLLSRIWFVATFYFIAYQYISSEKQFKKFIWLYIIPFILVIFYTLNRHFARGIWDKQMAYEAVSPFYNDHTAYGAVLAMLIPAAVGLLLKGKYSKPIKVCIGFSVILLFTAVFFSYSRAAWLSLFVTSIVFLLIHFKIRLRSFIFMVLAGFTVLLILKEDITQKVEKNKTDSSTDITKHLESMSNVQTDASNVERINRWNCAIRMFKEEPIFGFGPGTYMFKYAPFQISRDRSEISTDFGNRGNAHSEYLGPLAEQGLLGGICFVTILILSMYYGIKRIKESSGQEKILLYGACLGLASYFVHGFLNNFLDTDKASCLFWGFLVFIAASDIRNKEQNQ